MGQNAVPQLGLGPRDGIMGLRQLLNVIRASRHRVLKDLHRADLQHVQDNLCILRIILVPAVVQRFAGPCEGHRRHQLQVEPGEAKMIHQHAMIVACGFKTDTHWQAVFSQDRDQPHEVISAVGYGEPPSARFARDSDQHLVPMFGNVDAYQNTGIRSMLNLGHGRSPLWCGSQNHHRDLRPGCGRLLR